jgi:hypothetical protein
MSWRSKPAPTLRQAQAAIARAQAGVNAGKNKRSREPCMAESMIELGSVYEILARRPWPMQLLSSLPEI